MSVTFDPYYKWLAIPPSEQPPNHYRLLALALFESDSDVIATAADQRMAHVRSFQGGQYVDASQRLLNELAAARICLLRADKKALYDEALRRKFEKEAARSTPPPLPTTASQSPAAPIQTTTTPDGPDAGDTPTRAEERRNRSRPIAEDPLAPAARAAAPAASTWVRTPAHPEFEVDWPPASIVTKTDPAESLEIDPLETISDEPSPAQIAAAQALAEQFPDTAPSLASPVDAGSPAAVLEDGDDPLRLIDEYDRDPLPKLVRRRKPIPRILFVGPLIGIGAVIAAAIYSNARDAKQDADDANAGPPVARAVARPSNTVPPVAVMPGKPNSAEAGATPTFGSTEPILPGDNVFAPPAVSPSAGSDTPSVPNPTFAKPLPNEQLNGKEPAPSRLAVPDAEAQRKALAEVKKVYKDDFAKATASAQGREALATKLTDEAKNTKDDPTMRYVLALEALEVSVKLCDVNLASELVGGLCFYYDIDSWDLKAKTLSQLAATAKSSNVRLVIASFAYALVDQALSEERYDVAVQLSSTAADMATTLRDAGLRAKILEAHSRAHRMQRDAAAVQVAQQRLGNQSDDAAAHLIIGRFYCMERDDWDSGLPHLLRGSDADLRALAERERAGATRPTDQVRLADAWWDSAEQRHDPGDSQLIRGMRSRAVYWYRRALPDLSGFDESKAERRIADFEASNPVKPQ